MPPVIFENPETSLHKAEYCSRAAFIQFIITAIVIILPIVVVYQSDGFWIKESTFREQPEIRFKNQYLLLLHTQNTQDNFLAWSTFDSFNDLHRGYLRVVSVTYYSEDWNQDSLSDRFIAELTIPMNKGEETVGFDLFMVFDYNLKQKSRLKMETMIHVSHNSASPGGNYYLNGDIRLYLRQPLFHRGVDQRYQKSVFNNNQLFVEGFDLFKFYDDYSKRNVTAYIDNPMSIWTPGRVASQPFRIKLSLNIGEDLICICYTYQTGFWELVKWGWVQYLTVLLIFDYVFTRIRRYIFENQLVPTMVIRPFRDEASASAVNKLQFS